MAEGWQERSSGVGSWRGIVFEVDQTDTTVGHRIVVHEYPRRDTPWSEPLGRKARKFSVSAWVASADYDLIRQKLAEAVERGDVGELVHPGWARVQARCEEARFGENDRQLRRVSIQFSFLEAGEQVFPAVQVDARSATVVAAGMVRAGSEADVAQAEAALAKVPAWYARDYARFVRAESQQLAFAARITDIRDDIRDVIATTDDIVQLVVFAGADLVQPVASLLTAASRIAYEAQLAWSRLIRRLAISRAAEVVTRTRWESYEQAVGVVDVLAEIIDREIADEQTSAMLGTLIDLRALLFTAIEDASNTLARERDMWIPEPTPAHVVAFWAYGDPLRDAEIVRRNGIRRHGFVVGSVRVLTA